MSSLFTHSMLMLADSTASQLPSGFNSETQKALSGSTVAIFAGLAVLAIGVIWAVFFRKSAGACCLVASVALPLCHTQLIRTQEHFNMFNAPPVVQSRRS